MGKASQRKKDRKKRNDDIVQLYVHLAAKVFPEYYSDARCLNATRVTVEVLKAFKVPARPLVTYAYAFNEPMIQLLDVYEDPTTEQMDEVGAWSVAVAGEVLDTPGYPAHLVAVVDDKLMIDAAAGQFSRPAKDLSVPEVIGTGFPNGFLTGAAPLIVREGDERGPAMVYKARPDDLSYLETPGFQLSPWNQNLVEKMVEALKRM